MPRFVMYVRANAENEIGKPKTDDLLAMGAYNESLAAAGILESAEGLLPSSRDSYRVAFHESGAPTVQAGPFDVKTLVSGHWFLKVKDAEEALEWAKKVPFKEGGVVELRRVATMEDFGEAFTEELKEKEGKLREKVEGGAKGE